MTDKNPSEFAAEKYRRGAELVQKFDRDLIELGVNLLRTAFEEGSREAGYELSALPGHIDPELSGLSREMRAELLEEQALNGFPSAALNLYYVYGDALSAERVKAALAAVANSSTEAKYLLERF